MIEGGCRVKDRAVARLQNWVKKRGGGGCPFDQVLISKVTHLLNIFQMQHYKTPAVEFVTAAGDSPAVVVYHNISSLGTDVPAVNNAWYLRHLTILNRGASVAAATAPLIDTPTGRFAVAAPTGPLTREYDDVRRYAEAASSGMKALLSHGVLRANSTVAVVLQSPPSAIMDERYDEYAIVSALGVLAELHVLPEIYEAADRPSAAAHIASLSAVTCVQFVLSPGALKALRPNAAAAVIAMEEGRRIARDVGGSDPERMSPIRAAEAIASYFAREHKDCVNVEVESDPKLLAERYPLLAAVARASLHVPRHAPRVVHLTYTPPADVPARTDAVELHGVGKGICYDTGGADLKVGGAMMGMSRDKAGAAALAGLVATAARLRYAACVRISLAFVRNSIGSDAYVSDEIIRSAAGVRVRVGNTDAEGRMVLADLLGIAARRVADASPDGRPRLVLTCATLTGHVGRAYGPYVAALPNAAATALAQRLAAAGDIMADPFEVSRLRREDYAFVGPLGPREDVLQANSLPSTLTSRGHQYPAAFLAIASGIAAMARPPPFIHLDIASAAEVGQLGRLTGTPIVALTRAFLLQDNSSPRSLQRVGKTNQKIPTAKL